MTKRFLRLNEFNIFPELKLIAEIIMDRKEGDWVRQVRSKATDSLKGLIRGAKLNRNLP